MCVQLACTSVLNVSNYVTSAHSDGNIPVTLFVAAVGEKNHINTKEPVIKIEWWMINERLSALYGTDLEE